MDAMGTRSLVDNSVLDTAICAIKFWILLASKSKSRASHGAIKGSSSNARQVKALYRNAATPTNYDVQLEQRQPLEIRVTDIDLGRLGHITWRDPPGYLLPNSGIIYAIDDALPDLSNTTTEESY